MNHKNNMGDLKKTILILMFSESGALKMNVIMVSGLNLSIPPMVIAPSIWEIR